MNQSPRLDPTEHAELLQLLPPPGEPRLPTHRHDLLKDAFLEQIADRPAAARPPRRRFALIAASVAAAVLLAAVITAAVLNGHPNSPHGPTVAIASADPNHVASLMQQVASVAGRRPQVPIGKNDFVYVKSGVAWLIFADEKKTRPGDPRVLDKVHTREVWVPATQLGKGLLRDYLGERQYLIRDTELGKAGTLVGMTAVLRRGVVHRAGDLPR